MGSQRLSAYFDGLASRLIDDTGVKRKIIGLINGYGGGSSSTPGYTNLAGFPATGSTDKLYLAEDTGTIYYWDGTTYVPVSGVNGSGAFTDITGNPNSNTLLKKQINPLRVIYLSQRGVPDDADVAMYSSTFGTDGYAAIQAIYDLYDEDSPLEIHIDTHTSISDTIRFGSNTTTIFHPGCGLILRDGANCAMFVNKNPVFSGTPTDRNIYFVGHGGILNGNAYRGGVWMQTELGNGTAGRADLISFYGVENYAVEDLTLRNNKVYQVCSFNGHNGHYRRLVTDCGDPTLFVYRDGLHFDGNCENCSIDGAIVNAGDDGLGINNEDSYTGHAVYGDFYTLDGGPTSNITIRNVNLIGKKGLRLYNFGARLDNIVVENITGSVIGYWFISNSVSDNSLTNIGKVTIRDINVRVTEHAERNCDAAIDSNFDHLILEKVSCNYFDIANQPKYLFNGGAGVIIKKLDIIDYSSITDSANYAPHFYFGQTEVDTLFVRAATVKRSSAVADSPLIFVESYIKTLIIEGGEFENINNLVVLQYGGKVDYIICTGIKHLSDYPTIVNNTTNPVLDIYASGYTGYEIIGGTGAFTSQRGDAFTDHLTRPLNAAYLSGYTPFVGTDSGDVTNASGIYSSAAPGGFSHMVSSVKIPAGQSGAVAFKFQAGDAAGVIVGLKTTSALNASSNYQAGVTIDPSPYPIYKVVNGSGSAVGSNASIGNYYQVSSDGTTVILEESTDDGATWAQKGTAFAVNPAVNDLYVGIEIPGAGASKVYFLQTIGMS